MRKISGVDAKAHSSEPADRAGAGGPMCVTRRGTAIATPRKRIDVAELRAMTDAMPSQDESVGEFIRRMRDADRY